MRLTALSADGFKNLESVSLIPDPSYNLILGENAQGKTNLLEAIWALTGCRSFRGTRERDYLPFSGGNLQVEAKFQDARREQSVRLCMVPGSVPEKKFWCNDIPQKSSALFSVFHCVAFTPDDLSLVDGGPERRRTFLDMCSAQLHAPMLGLVRRYQLALQQRNAVLKQHLPESQAEGLLLVWDKQLEQLGTEIAVQRSIYVRRLAEVCVPAVCPDRTGQRDHLAPLSVQRVRQRCPGNTSGAGDTRTGAAVRRKNAPEPCLGSPAGTHRQRCAPGRPVPRHRRQAGKGVRLTGTEKKPGAVTETGAGGDLQQAPEGIAGGAAG